MRVVQKSSHMLVALVIETIWTNGVLVALFDGVQSA